MVCACTGTALRSTSLPAGVMVTSTPRRSSAAPTRDSQPRCRRRATARLSEGWVSGIAAFSSLRRSPGAGA